MVGVVEWEQELGHLVERIGLLNAAYGRVYESPMVPASVRKADDDATWPLAIGQHAQYCLAQAIDMCEGIADLVTNGRGLQLPLAATYPLARAAIESSSVVVWMLDPATRRERVVRRLQAAHGELPFEKAFIHAASQGQSASQQQSMQRAYAKDAKRLKARMREIARANGISPDEYVEKMPGWKDIVEAAALHNERTSLVVAAWRFASGLTHPSFLRGRLAHEFVGRRAEGDGPEGEITASAPWVVMTAFVAEALTRKALAELQATKERINEELPVPTPQRKA
ncbi:hypothetical protein [Microbacterium lacticum]